jgi:hypothetical protein
MLKVVRADYMFRPRFEAIFRPFDVEQLIKFTYETLACYGMLWDPIQLYRVIKIYINPQNLYMVRRAECRVS